MFFGVFLAFIRELIEETCTEVPDWTLLGHFLISTQDSTHCLALLIKEENPLVKSPAEVICSMAHGTANPAHAVMQECMSLSICGRWYACATSCTCRKNTRDKHQNMHLQSNLWSNTPQGTFKLFTVIFTT